MLPLLSESCLFKPGAQEMGIGQDWLALKERKLGITLFSDLRGSGRQLFAIVGDE